jgi:hypothetical protein
VPTDHDPLGHGTGVLRILDSILPETVPIASGRVGTRAEDVTVLQVARSFAHLVAVASPSVVNLSLAPRDDKILCPFCRRTIPVPAFHSMLLPFVFNLAAATTIPVMAAGNDGRPANPRMLFPGMHPPLFAVATGTSGARASYSNYVVEHQAPSMTAFGGDPEDDNQGFGIFASDRSAVGTSYAAPFVTCVTAIAQLGEVTRLPSEEELDVSTAMRYVLDQWDEDNSVVGAMTGSWITKEKDWIFVRGLKVPKRK